MLQTRPKNNFSYSYSYVDKNEKTNNNLAKNKLSTALVVVYLSLLLIIGTILVSYICQFVHIAHLNYKISSLEEELNLIKKDIYQLNLKLAKEMSVARIEKIAKSELNMIEPDKVEVVLLENKDAEKIDSFPDLKERKVFFVRIFNDLLEKMGTVRAKELR